MHFTTATIATMVAATTATIIPRADYGGWNVSISSTGGSDKQRTETVTGVYANSQLTDNIPVTCHFQGMLNGEMINKLTCEPASFDYEFASAGYDDGYLYELTLTQTLSLDNTNITVKGISNKFKRTCDGITGKSCSASSIIVEASTAVA
ncbi:hypothetical protein SVAN01_11755 [Stagonosporopsis vannaccii]|nr:hypothetical protein SVAN01_11755 [Stagonosporopsis vannaccii]